ncbi:site-specific integrase, partial [Pseudomonas sp. PA-3-6E]|uniref:site-specific integrase n=7 Tax=Pseudomonas TaxID=286 RepID=UPI001F3223BA
VYNKENNIFEMMFYIEKNRKDYLPFYVGNATQKAAEALEKLQLIYLNIDYKTHSIGKLKDTNITLFRHKLFSAKGFLGSYTDYNFEAYKTGQAYHFISSRLKFEIHSTPHMFRRLYCTIFMNQHEFPHLPALSYQLQHECLATTQIYITSPITQSEAATLSKIYDWQIEEYIDTHKH